MNCSVSLVPEYEYGAGECRAVASVHGDKISCCAWCNHFRRVNV